LALVFRNVVTLVVVLASVGVAAGSAWLAVTRRGRIRWIAAAVAVVALVGSGVEMAIFGAVDELIAFAVAGVVFGWATRRAIAAAGRTLPEHRVSQARDGRALRQRRAVLLMNPKSGGGKVERFDLVGEAKNRGIEPILLQPGDDLRVLAREAAASTDVIGMAGGDGSQALVAQVAMERDVAFVCVPAGTRNHLALDLGLDRDDVAGALDAFDSEVEHRVDLAFVNERIFVNNVSLGVYAEIAPKALRIRLPPAAVGLSPAALRPGLDRTTLQRLWELATATR
jgi:hypothetical protein